ncbi:MAG: hypothetical protein GY941_05395 [Planctomycetes bacterium]|nr:hypothetical protein [Planctomycetota bacterium]
MKANIVNRTALTVIPKQPFIDWANSLDDDGPKLKVNDPNYEPTVYLIDEVIGDAALNRIMRRYYPQIFENELAGWHLVVEDWPKKRDSRTFRKWFDVTVSTVVLDLSQHHIALEDYDV